MLNRYTSLLSFHTRPARLAFSLVYLVSVGEDGITEAPFRVGSQTTARLVFAENSVEQRRLVLAPVVADLAAQLVERVCDLVHLVGGGHLGEVTVKILGEDLPFLEGHLPQVDHVPLLTGERQVK